MSSFEEIDRLLSTYVEGSDQKEESLPEKKIPWSQVITDDPLDYMGYLEYDLVEYDDGEIKEKGIIVGVEDLDRFVREVDYSEGITIPDYYYDDLDTFPGEEDGYVIGIRESGFAEIEGLTRIQLPKGIYTIGEYAFSECQELMSISLPNTLKYIGFRAFSGCCELNHVMLPESVQVINMEAFSGCGFTEILIPAGTKRIGPFAFSGCKNLKRITILNPDIEIDEDCFYGCENVKTIIAPMALAGTILQQFEDSLNNIVFEWLDIRKPENGIRAISVKIIEVEYTTFADGTSGFVIHFMLANNLNRSVEITVSDVFLIRENSIKTIDYWLSGHSIKNRELWPEEMIECAGIIIDDSIMPGDFSKWSKIGIALSIDKEEGFEDEDLIERQEEFESSCSNHSPGDWTEVLDISYNGDRSVIFSLVNNQWEQSTTTIPLKPALQKAPEIQFADFVVRVRLFHCEHGHHIEAIRAVVNILSSEGNVVQETVSAGYCRECNCYFILEPDFIQIQRKGRLLCQVLEEDEYRTKGDAIMSGNDMKAQSVLRRCGYTVNAKDNLSEQQRRGILEQAIMNNLYSASEICGFLDWLIDYHGSSKTRDMSAAIRKWSADRAYIQNYEIMGRRKVGIGSITHKKN